MRKESIYAGQGHDSHRIVLIVLPYCIELLEKSFLNFSQFFFLDLLQNNNEQISPFDITFACLVT